MLIGTPTAPYVVDDEGIYQVREGSDGAVRFTLSARGEVVPKGKAYCQYVLSGQPAEVPVIWSEETLVKAVLDAVGHPDAPHYDLQGRRIYKQDADATGKRIHIVNGRKVVVK